MFCNLLKSGSPSGARWSGETFSDGRNLGRGYSWRTEDEGQRWLSILRSTGTLPCLSRDGPGSVVSGLMGREGRIDAGRASGQTLRKLRQSASQEEGGEGKRFWNSFTADAG